MNSVVHFEIPVDDAQRASTFYSETFGWQLTKVPMQGMDYWMVTTVETDEKRMPKKPGAINGGLTPRDETAKTPVIVINVPNVDDYIKKVEAAGGKVVMPKQTVGNMGYYARVTDSEGNVIGIWEDIPHPHG